MSWYVKYEGTEEISGPMSQEQALAHVDQVDGMAFHGDIFEPKFAVSEEIEDIISDIRYVRSKHTFSVSDNEKIQNCIDALVLISREKLEKSVSATVRGGVFDVDTIDSGVRLVVCDYDTDGSEENLMEDESGSYVRREFSKGD